jgi:hypothetical protein
MSTGSQLAPPGPPKFGLTNPVAKPLPIGQMTEFDFLRGDPAKARSKLGWKHRVSFEQLVAEMIAADLKSVASEKTRVLAQIDLTQASAKSATLLTRTAGRCVKAAEPCQNSKINKTPADKADRAVRNMPASASFDV